MDRRSTALSLVLAALVVSSAARADDRKPYTLADLKALAGQHSWRELVEHLEDIAPTSRDATWRGLAQQAGLGLLSQADAADGLRLGEALLARYPALKDSKDFMTKRAELGYAAFETCFKGKIEWADICGEQLKPFVEADPTNAELAFRLAKLLPPRAHHHYAVPAFAIAIQKKDDARCKDPDVRLAVVSGLGLARAANEDVVAASIQLGSSVCWSALHDAIQEAMGGDATDYLKNTCPFMKQKQTLPPLLTKRCDAVTQNP